MVYEVKDFSHLLGTEGFSDQLLNNHFTLYNGYVTNTNKVVELLKTVEKSSPQYAELKRRFGWEFSGMRLHELYFGNMAKGGKGVPEAVKAKLAEAFGSFDAWLEDFKATGAMRGIGWVLLCLDPETNKLFNVWINEHEIGHLAGTKPLFVMDVFEHAFMIDYGLKKADYIAAFLQAADWEVVAKRLE